MCHLSTSLYYHLGTIHLMLISWVFSLISFNKEREVYARYGPLGLLSVNAQLNTRPLLLVMKNKQGD